MRHTTKFAALLIAVMSLLNFNGIAQQVQLPKTASDVAGLGGYPYGLSWPERRHTITAKEI